MPGRTWKYRGPPKRKKTRPDNYNNSLRNMGVSSPTVILFFPPFSQHIYFSASSSSLIEDPSCIVRATTCRWIPYLISSKQRGVLSISNINITFFSIVVLFYYFFFSLCPLTLFILSLFGIFPYTLSCDGQRLRLK